MMSTIEITPEEYNVHMVNSIAVAYPKLRQASKGPTFALTYGGTSYALMNQCGLSSEDSTRIESAYHEMYSTSDSWVADKLEQASKDGYVTTAFGLRVRTPILNQIYLTRAGAPYAGKAEGRTAGNALGQGWGMLNIHAANRFMTLVNQSRYKYVIRLICEIHDAIYVLGLNTVGCIKFINDTLIECMRWQELPEIKHKIVKLGAELDIFYPSWEVANTIPNDATKKQILDSLR